jgi:hypothetical protein
MWSAYGVLCQGLGVCQSYAMAFMLLCQKLDIPCASVISPTEYTDKNGKKVNGMNHAWNQVKLGDTWYHVDTTWNDPATLGRAGHEFLLLSDKAMATRSEKHQNYIAPFAATSTKYDDWAWKNVTAPLAYGQGKWYMPTANTFAQKGDEVTVSNAVKAYDPNTNTLTDGFLLKDSYAGIKNATAFKKNMQSPVLVYDNSADKFYYNARNKVYAVSPRGGKKSAVQGITLPKDVDANTIFSGLGLFFDELVAFGATGKETTLTAGTTVRSLDLFKTSGETITYAESSLKLRYRQEGTLKAAVRGQKAVTIAPRANWLAWCAENNALQIDGDGQCTPLFGKNGRYKVWAVTPGGGNTVGSVGLDFFTPNGWSWSFSAPKNTLNAALETTWWQWFIYIGLLGFLWY